MSDHSDLLDLVADDLKLVEKTMQAADGTFSPLAGALSILLASGGKRLRPALALLAGRFYPHINREHLVFLAAAVEMLHSATLVHDDVIDGALLRRGSPTLNSSWSRGATILAGDYLFARAAAFAAATESVRIMRIFAETLMTICDGELRQLHDIGNWSQPRDAYYQRIYGKTAALFASATESAAVLGGGDEAEIQHLRDYGYNLGMAFQIVDDVLDFVGDEAVLGKPVGNDLRIGTVTLPVFHYLQDHPEAMAVLQASGNGHAPDEALTQLVAAIGKSPAIEATKAEAANFVTIAKIALEPFPDQPAKAALIRLADYVVERSL